MTGQTPQAIKDRPVITPVQAYYLDAFETLSEWRTYSAMGDLMPFTLADMVSYFTIYKIESVELRDSFVKHMKSLDRVYLDRKAKAAKTEKTEAVAQGKEGGYLVH